MSVFKLMRVVLLLSIFFVILINTWMTEKRMAAWERPILVTIYPIAANQEPATLKFVKDLDESDFADINRFMNRESQPYGFTVTPAFRFDATRDTHTRPNHMAANGFIAAIDDPEWDRVSPPLGFRCRCAKSLVTRSQLRRLGLLREDGTVITHRPRGFGAAGPDPGFVSGGVR